MSWMDSWSRPTKVHVSLEGRPSIDQRKVILIFVQHAATPPPLYLTPGGEAIPYCHTCGRVISKHRSDPLILSSFYLVGA